MEVVSSFDWMIWKRSQTKAARWEGVRGNHLPATSDDSGWAVCGAKRRGPRR
jgi:hypothetical protein